MKAVALTGSFGSGKTAVLKLVRSFGFPAVDSDAIVSSLYRKAAVKKRLAAAFGPCSKKELAGMAFSSSGKRRRLESILHPLVWREVSSRLSSFERRGKAIAFAEVPLLFEAGWQNRFDLVVFVKCPRKTCLKRLAEKGVSRKEALLRLKAQMPQWKKVKKAGWVIDNGGSLAGTRAQVRALARRLSD